MAGFASNRRVVSHVLVQYRGSQRTKPHRVIAVVAAFTMAASRGSSTDKTVKGQLPPTYLGTYPLLSREVLRRSWSTGPKPASRPALTGLVCALFSRQQTMYLN